MFYQHPKMADGHLGKCKECTRADVRKHRLKNLERVRQYDKRRSKTPERKARTAEAVRRWNKRNPLGYLAHCIVNNSIRDGKLSKQPCEVCGSEQVHAHHADYSKPLQVRWLCAAHHSQAHRSAS